VEAVEHMQSNMDAILYHDFQLMHQSSLRRKMIRPWNSKNSNVLEMRPNVEIVWKMQVGGIWLEIEKKTKLDTGCKVGPTLLIGGG